MNEHPVSGGGAISDEELASLEKAAATFGENLSVEGPDVARLIARLRSSEARAEAAERERDELWKALLESEKRRSEMHGSTATQLFDEAKRQQHRAYVAESRLAAADAAVEAERDELLLREVGLEEDDPFNMAEEQRRCQVAADSLAVGDIHGAATALYGTASRIVREFLIRKNADARPQPTPLRKDGEG